MKSLENCPVFGFYKASRKLIKLYNHHLEPLNLTYPQYLVLSVLEKEMSYTVEAIGNELNLDSGTLTPLLKRLEGQGFLTRKICLEDERKKSITLTKQGLALTVTFQEIRQKIKALFGLSTEERAQLHQLLARINQVSTESLT